MIGPATLGRVTRLTYRSVGPMLQASVLRVEFRAPDAQYYEQDLPNNRWDTGCPALQFLANWGYRPSEIDGTSMDVRDDKLHVPLAPMDPADPTAGWGLAEAALDGGETALEEAEWFDPDLGDEAAQQPTGADSGGADGGGGGRGAEQVEIEADEAEVEGV